jgi:hypothetical protein
MHIMHRNAQCWKYQRGKAMHGVMQRDATRCNATGCGRHPLQHDLLPAAATRFSMISWMELPPKMEKAETCWISCTCVRACACVCVRKYAHVFKKKILHCLAHVPWLVCMTYYLTRMTYQSTRMIYLPTHLGGEAGEESEGVRAWRSA